MIAIAATIELCIMFVLNVSFQHAQWFHWCLCPNDFAQCSCGVSFSGILVEIGIYNVNAYVLWLINFSSLSVYTTQSLLRITTMRTPYRNILKAYISLTTVRIWNWFSVHNFGMKEEHFKLKNTFSIFFGKNRVFDKKIMNFWKPLICPLGIHVFRKRSVFAINWFLKTG